MFAACVSATICHDIKRHPDESSFLKQKKDELKAMKSKLIKAKDGMKSKEEAYKSLQNNFATKVQSDLINSYPDKYLRKTTTGALVPNWLIVNSDIRKLEKACKGKIPSKSDIPRLIKQYDENFHVLNDSSSEEKVTGHNINPVKSLWERKGIKFPGSGPPPNYQQHAMRQSATSTTTETHQQGTESSDAQIKQQEEYLIQVAMNESLKTHSNDNTSTNVSHSTKSEAVSDNSNEFEGLELLFEAAKLVA